MLVEFKRLFAAAAIAPVLCAAALASSEARADPGPALYAHDLGTLGGQLAEHGERAHAVAWVGPEHALRDLGPGVARAVNAHDVVAGAVAHPRQDQHPFAVYLPRLWDLRRGTAIALRGFSAAPDEISDGQALDVDDRGVAVGYLERSRDMRSRYAVVFDRYASPAHR